MPRRRKARNKQKDRRTFEVQVIPKLEFQIKLEENQSDVPAEWAVEERDYKVEVGVENIVADIKPEYVEQVQLVEPVQQVRQVEPAQQVRQVETPSASGGRRERDEEEFDFQTTEYYSGYKWKPFVLMEPLEYDPNNDNKYKCLACKEQFTNQSGVAQHLGAHSRRTEFFCSRCRKVFRPRKGFPALCGRPRTDLATCDDCLKPKNRPYECDVCGKRFTRNYTTAHHARLFHTGPYRCAPCAVEFADKSDLLAHNLVHYKGPFRCPISDRRYRYLRHFAERVATFKRPTSLQCYHCGIWYPDLPRLMAHSRDHVRGREHRCRRCRKVFDCRSSLAEHKLLHDSLDLVRRFGCLHCDMRFDSKAHLVRHEKSHMEKPYECRHCPKKFAERSQLDKHLLYHPQEGSLACSVCKRKYKVMSTLRRHMKSHISLARS